MFTKFAYAEAQILDVKGSPGRQVTASLDTISDFDDYRTKDGYMYVRIRAISSRVNKNHDGWPSVELAGGPEILNAHKQSSDGFTIHAKSGNKQRGFGAFVGKPIFVDHNNSNPKRGRGVIVDSKFSVLDQKTASQDDYWKSSDVDPEHLPASEIELLLEVDSKQYPKFAKSIRDGDLDGFSMGANVEYTKCSHCGNVAHDPAEFCSHVLMKGAHHDIKTAEGKRISRKSYENCYGCGFFEISGVFDPADETALTREVRASVLHEGIMAGPGLEPSSPDPVRPHMDQQVSDLAMQYQMQGVDEEQAYAMAQHNLNNTPAGVLPGHGEGGSMEEQPGMWDAFPKDPQRPDNNFEAWMHDTPPNDPRWSSWNSIKKHAENPLPQEMMTKAPDEVDTMREEMICPICGSDMDSEQCKVCNYTKPPKEFDNPDLQEAQQVRDEMKQQDAAQSDPPQDGPGPDPSAPPTPGGPPPSPGGPGSPLTSKTQDTARVTNRMLSWTPKVNSKTAARINQVERPMRPGGTQTSNEPQDEIVLSDQTRPVTSTMRTAQQLIAAAKQNNGEIMNARTADGPTPPGDTSAEKRVDVIGVGGFDQATNEEASKADTQTEVIGVGGVGLEDVSPDSTESLPTAGQDSLDSGFNTDKTTDDSGPTSTYGDSDGSHSGITDPVTSETPYWIDESKWSRVVLHSDDNDKSFSEQPQQGGGEGALGTGGTAVKGVQPIAESFGERVNVLEHKTSPANNSGPTTTWTGTDGNGVLKQQDPVTQDSQEWGGVKVPDVQLHTTGATKTRYINASRLVKAEKELGMCTDEDEFNRLSYYIDADPREVTTKLQTLAQVKTTGTRMAAQQKLATRVPRSFGAQTLAGHDFQRIASDKQSSGSESVSDTLLDSALFTR